MAAPKDLRDFLLTLENRRQLRRVTVDISAQLEIAELTERVSKSATGNVALLFERVIDSAIPVVTNTFGAEARVCLALGVTSLDEAGQRARQLLSPERGGGVGGVVRSIGAVSEIMRFGPRLVDEAPCQEIVLGGQPSVRRLPALVMAPDEPNPLLTLPVICADDPVTRRRVVATGALQLQDDHTLTVDWLGESPFAAPVTATVPMAIALGADPATIMTTVATLPETVDRLLVAGWLRRDRVELVRAKTIAVEVPARAEIVLEGYLAPADPRPHGPVADDTGHYRPAAARPTFVVTTMTHRRAPILPAMVIGRPPAEAHWLAKAGERLALPLIQLSLPEIVDLNSPVAFGDGRLLLVRLRKRYPGHARQVIAALFGHALTARAKVIIVFDADVDVQQLPEALLRWLSATDMRRDAVLFDGPLPADDYASPATGYGGKIGFDATAKLPEEAQRPWPRAAPMLPVIQHRIDELWAALKL